MAFGFEAWIQEVEELVLRITVREEGKEGVEGESESVKGVLRGE
jgi:hypothetical protein